MKMKENIVAKLIWKDDRCACTLADKMIYSLFFGADVHKRKETKQRNHSS